MRTQRAVLLAGVMVAALVAPMTVAQGAGAHDHVLPGESIQAAVDAASSGDVVHVHAGVYKEFVHVTTPGVTIRGDGPGATTLDGLKADGSKTGRDGILVTADNVKVELLGVRNFGGNGVYFDGVTGFYMESLWAIDNGAYGLYAIRSSVGFVNDSYARGHYDSGLYIGEVANCQCVLQGNLIEGNLIGYSGTGASHVTIRDNIFRNNAAGILPNVLPQEPQPQTNLVVEDNAVYDNNNYWASENWHFLNFHVPAGYGILIAGGVQDTVRNNQVFDNDRAGIALVWFFTEPSLNRVVDNELWNNGVDLWWDEGGANNCWENNVDPNTGLPATFDGGPVWGAVGHLPDCSTPNAGAPNPAKLAEMASRFVFGCELENHTEGPDGPCHVQEGAGAWDAATELWEAIPTHQAASAAAAAEVLA